MSYDRRSTWHRSGLVDRKILHMYDHVLCDSVEVMTRPVPTIGEGAGNILAWGQHVGNIQWILFYIRELVFYQLQLNLLTDYNIFKFGLKF